MRVCDEVPDFAIGRGCIVYSDRGRCIDLQIDPDSINWHMGATIVLGERAVASAASLLGLYDPEADVAGLRAELEAAQARVAALEAELVEARAALGYVVKLAAVGEAVETAEVAEVAEVAEAAEVDDVINIGETQRGPAPGDVSVDDTVVVPPSVIASIDIDPDDLATESKAEKAAAKKAAAAAARAKPKDEA